MADALRFLSVALHLRTLRGAVLALLTALVLLQTVGVLHRVAHAHGLHSSVAAAEGATAKPSALDLMASLQRLWGEHSNAVDCQLFDQTCPDAWHTPDLVLMPVLPVARWMVATLQERFALVERFYAARGPPVLHRFDLGCV